MKKKEKKSPKKDLACICHEVRNAILKAIEPHQTECQPALASYLLMQLGIAIAFEHAPSHLKATQYIFETLHKIMEDIEDGDDETEAEDDHCES